jgi:hypothetical protein
MSVLFRLLDKAVDLTFDLLKDNRESRASSASTAQLDNTEIVDAIDAVARQLDRTAADIVAEIKNSAEQSQLEKLSSQAKTLKFAMEFGNEVMLGQAVIAITEQTDYSTMRLGEGKLEWFAPWMIAETIRLEALHLLAKNEKAKQVVNAEIHKFRVNPGSRLQIS